MSISYTPECERGIGHITAKYTSLLNELGYTLEVRPDYVEDGVAHSAYIAWHGQDRFYIAMDGEPVGMQ